MARIVAAYFFAGETGVLYGPYPTPELAKEASEIYGRALSEPIGDVEVARNEEINKLSRDLGEELRRFYNSLLSQGKKPLDSYLPLLALVILLAIYLWIKQNEL
jgi:hypothetical protein